MFKSLILNCFSSYKKPAFTLAEVLITLGIIGIVAALTIPNLITGYQKHQTAEKLKSTYSIITQAAKLYTSDWGIDISGFDTQLPSQEFIERYFAPYIKIINVCKTVGECYPNGIPLAIDRKTKVFANSAVNLYMATLPNGAYITVFGQAAGTIFYIDLNGAEKPNLSGRDIFYFFLINASTLGSSACVNELEDIKKGKIKSGIYPGSYGHCYKPHALRTREVLLAADAIHRACNHNATYIYIGLKEGDACAAVIMLDGWKISKDYPW